MGGPPNHPNFSGMFSINHPFLGVHLSGPTAVDPTSVSEVGSELVGWLSEEVLEHGTWGGFHCHGAMGVSK